MLQGDAINKFDQIQTKHGKELTTALCYVTRYPI